MSSRPLVILGSVIIVISVAAAIGYAVNGRGSGAPAVPSTDTSTTTPADTDSSFYQSTSTPDQSSTPTPGNPRGPYTLDIPYPASTTIDTSAWVIYTDNQHGYSISYPSNLVRGMNGAALTLALPKNSYFHWPLLDDAKITVTAGSACATAVSGGGPNESPVAFNLSGRTFSRSVSTDVGAGQLYTEVIYSTKQGGTCYSIDFLDHGTNGAGFYVDDAALVKKYDDQHSADMAGVYDVVNGIAASLRILAQ